MIKGKKKREGGKPRNRPLTTENSLMIRGEVGGGMGEISDVD